MTISFSAVRQKNTLGLKASSQGVELKKSYWFVLFPRWSGEYISQNGRQFSLIYITIHWLLKKPILFKVYFIRDNLKV